jgi:hypothetical protein
MIVHAFGGEREVTVTLDLVAQRADHLRMAEVATLANVDVATGQLQRRVRPDTIDHFDRALQVEQGGNLDQTADRDHNQDPDDQDDRVLFENVVPCPE